MQQRARGLGFDHVAPAAVGLAPDHLGALAGERILVDGGFKLVEVTPVDQFPWTGHLELVAKFRR